MDLINVRKLLIKLILFSFDFSLSPTLQYLANFSIKKEKKEEEKGEKEEKEKKEKEKEEVDENYAPLHNSFLRNLTACQVLNWIESRIIIIMEIYTPVFGMQVPKAVCKYKIISPREEDILRIACCHFVEQPRPIKTFTLHKFLQVSNTFRLLEKFVTYHLIHFPWIITLIQSTTLDGSLWKVSQT